MRTILTIEIYALDEDHGRPPLTDEQIGQIREAMRTAIEQVTDVNPMLGYGIADPTEWTRI